MKIGIVHHRYQHIDSHHHRADGKHTKQEFACFLGDCKSFAWRVEVLKVSLVEQCPEHRVHRIPETEKEIRGIDKIASVLLLCAFSLVSC